MKIGFDMLLFILLYTVAYGLMLINNGIFWDDWTLYNTRPEVIIETFKQVGIPILGPYHNFLLNTVGVLGYKVIAFLSFLIAGICLNGVLKSTAEITSSSRWFIICFFLLYPVNSARIAMITTPYSLCYMMFFLGWFLLVRYLHKPNLGLRFLINIVFFTSFITNSLLVFYAIIPLYILYDKKRQIRDFSSLARTLLTYWELWLNPIVFWILKNIYYKPYGFCEGYNKVSLQGVFQALTEQKISDTIYATVLEVIRYSFTFSPHYILLISAFVTCVIFKLNILQKEQKPRSYFLFIGIAAIILAIFPYHAVNRTDVVLSLNDWNSRHQLLIPLGAAFFLHYVLYHRNSWVRYFFNICFILFFTTVNVYAYFSYQVDAFKQQSIIYHLANHHQIKETTTIFVRDKAESLNAMGRKYRTMYEYVGMLKRAYGDETRLALPDGVETPDALDHFLRYKELFNMKDYKPGKPEVTVVIEKGSMQMGMLDVLTMRFYQVFDPPKFINMLKNVIVLRIEPVTK